jgi:hypothetical protein
LLFSVFYRWLVYVRIRGQPAPIRQLVPDYRGEGHDSIGFVMSLSRRSLLPAPPADTGSLLAQPRRRRNAVFILSNRARCIGPVQGIIGRTYRTHRAQKRFPAAMSRPPAWRWRGDPGRRGPRSHPCSPSAAHTTFHGRLSSEGIRSTPPAYSGAPFPRTRRVAATCIPD